MSSSAQSPSLRGSGRFQEIMTTMIKLAASCSIPFIAGQWSLHRIQNQLETLARLSQSPSLRGSGRFMTPT